METLCIYFISIHPYMCLPYLCDPVLSHVLWWFSQGATICVEWCVCELTHQILAFMINILFLNFPFFMHEQINKVLWGLIWPCQAQEVRKKKRKKSMLIVQWSWWNCSSKEKEFPPRFSMIPFWFQTLMNMPSIAPMEKIKHQTGAERAAAPREKAQWRLLLSYKTDLIKWKFLLFFPVSAGVWWQCGGNFPT